MKKTTISMKNGHFKDYTEIDKVYELYLNYEIENMNFELSDFKNHIVIKDHRMMYISKDNMDYAKTLIENFVDAENKKVKLNDGYLMGSVAQTLSEDSKVLEDIYVLYNKLKGSLKASDWYYNKMEELENALDEITDLIFKQYDNVITDISNLSESVVLEDSVSVGLIEIKNI